VVSHYTPLWEPSRPGHVYLDVTGTERLWGKAKDTGFRLGREIHRRLYLSGTVGVAGNKMVSSVASTITPSEALRDVDHGQEAAFMAPLKVTVVPGIGRVRQQILLEELNIIQVRELAALDMDHKRLIFGRQAYIIHQRAVGIDLTPVYPCPQRPVVSEEITLPQDENDDDRLLAALCGLVERCSYRLRRRVLVPRRAGLMIRYSDQMEIRRQLKLPAHVGFWDFDLYDPLATLFLKACTRRVRVRFIKVWFRDFSPQSGQLSLFHEPSPRRERDILVKTAVDRIRERYGETAIRHGKAA
jgi:DNA polymerase-4